MRSTIRRIACIGGGPGGLFFAVLARLADPDLEITVFERNRPDDTFGFGVVFSSTALESVHEADPITGKALRDHGIRWHEIEVRVKGAQSRCGGNGMTAIRRHTLLSLLQARAAAVGVDVRFECEVTRPEELAGYDLVVAADGANSHTRTMHGDVFQPSVEIATAKFIWFGTTHLFHGLTFVHAEGPHGVFAAHCYPISHRLSTFIVETDAETWRRAGLDRSVTDRPPGVSDLNTKHYLEGLFSDHLQGHELVTNKSHWSNFRTLRTARWRAGNIVLLGDAAHTAHFSVGSGTKMAMEDAIVLARQLIRYPADRDMALASYEAERRPQVERIQGSARPSLSWWERFGRYHQALEPAQFALHFLTRSIPISKLRIRDPDYVNSLERDWRQAHGTEPLETPLELSGYCLPRRAVTIERRPDNNARRRVAGDPQSGPIPLFATDELAPTEGPWGVWVAAPGTEARLTETLTTVDGVLDRARRRADGIRPPLLVAIHGGTTLTRTLLSEDIRMTRGLPTLIVEDTCGRDRATTLVLSGRADLVGCFTQRRHTAEGNGSA